GWARGTASRVVAVGDGSEAVLSPSVGGAGVPMGSVAFRATPEPGTRSSSGVACGVAPRPAWGGAVPKGGRVNGALHGRLRRRAASREAPGGVRAQGGSLSLMAPFSERKATLAAVLVPGPPGPERASLRLGEVRQLFVGVRHVEPPVIVAVPCMPGEL